MKLSRCLAMCAASALALGVTGTAADAAPRPNRTYEISFDGFCDGLTLNVPSAGLGTRISMDGGQIGCDTGAVYGQVGGRGKHGPENSTEYVTYVNYSIFAVIKQDHTFTYYVEQASGVIFESLVGTWSVGPPTLAADGAVSSAAAAVASAAAAVAAAGNSTAAQRPAGELDLVFDGFCDGMHLVTPSVGVGEKGTVDGHQTGCASDGVIGAKGGIAKNKHSYALQWTGGAIQTAVFSDHTWIHYVDSELGIQLLNSGTWSEGIPPAPIQDGSALPPSFAAGG